MTTLLTILAVIGLVAICYIVGKYNKSDNLFWILLISLMAGMAGGAIVSKLEHSNDKNITNTTQVNPTQMLPANSVDFYAALGSTLAFEHNSVSKDKEIPARDSSISYASSRSYGEILGPGPFSPRNKGTPGMPFDTS